MIANWPSTVAGVRGELVRQRDRDERVFRPFADAVSLPGDVNATFFRLSLLGALNLALK